jgi:uncharacterized protein YaiI (UPF0178 family)
MRTHARWHHRKRQARASSIEDFYEVPNFQSFMEPFRNIDRNGCGIISRDSHEVDGLALIGLMKRPHLYVDADACPVKDETYRVAKRYALKVTLVSNSWMRIPSESWLELVVVQGDLDAADDWIAEHADSGDIVVSADIPLAARCLAKGARVLGPRGRDFTEDSIGDAVATRELLANLREGGALTGGPPPIDKRDRSRFLHRLDEMIQEELRRPPAS